MKLPVTARKSLCVFGRESTHTASGVSSGYFTCRQYNSDKNDNIGHGQGPKFHDP